MDWVPRKPDIQFHPRQGRGFCYNMTTVALSLPNDTTFAT